MSLRRRELRYSSVVGRGLAAARVGVQAGPGAAHTILTVTDSGVDDGGGGTCALFTTAAPHGLDGGLAPLVRTDGVSNAAYNQLFNVDATPTPTTFYSIGASCVGDATGGTWVLA